MTIKNNQINSNFHQIAVVDADGLVTGIETGGVVLSDAANLTIGGGSAGQALITDGAGNLSWSTVDSANAAYANTAGVADVALSVDAANIVGEVANATFATSASSATVAASANAVSLANVSGVGNIASVNLSGNASQVLSGNGAWAAMATGGGYKYTREIHIDPVNGNDTTGTGAYDKPYLTIMKAHSVITSGQAVFLHVGAYTENVTWTKTNTDIIGLSQGGQVNTSGTWIVGTTTGASVRITDVAFNGTFQQNGTGRVFFRRCQVNGAFSKTSGEYLQAIDTDFGTSVAINSAGTVVIQGGQTNALTVNNASAVVSVADLISGAVFTNTAGTLLVSNSIIYSATPTTAAITSAAGTATYLYNTSTATSSGTQARVSFAGFWTTDSTRFDKANSTITGTNLGTISYSDAITVQGNLIVNGSINGSANAFVNFGSNIKVGGSGRLLSPGGAVSLTLDNNGFSFPSANGTNITLTGNLQAANLSGSGAGLSGLAGANVTGAVANATFAASAGSVTLANVSGAGNIASINLNGNGSQVLAGNGAWTTVSSGGNVEYANTAGVAYSVTGANVSGEVANAAFATTAGSATTASSATVAASANSVAGANVSGEVANAAFATTAGSATTASSASSVSGANVSGQVSSAASADVALSVARGNVSGAGSIGQLQWANAAGNLTSSDRYYIGLNGTAGINVSRDSAGAGFVASQYANTFSSQFTSGKARGSKASPIALQVNDTFGSMVFLPYTGNGSLTLDGVAGFNGDGPRINTTLTELPTGAGNIAGSRLNISVGNASSNSVVAVAGFQSDKTTNLYGNLVVDGVSTLGAVGNVKITGGSAGQVLSTDGAGNLTFTSSIANAGYANIAGSTNSVARSNVSGAGNVGQLQWANTDGNLTSNDRYYIGSNGTGGVNLSRDTSGALVIAASFHNTALSSSYITSRARGTKAAPLPVQVGDRIGSLFATPYTGTGTGVIDTVTGFVLDRVTGVFMHVTSLPTGNATTPGTSISFSAANSATNTQVNATFGEDGTLSLPRLNTYGNVASNFRSFTVNFQAVTFSTVIAPDAAVGGRTTIIATDNFTFNGFTNPVGGQTLEITMIQDNVGGRVMSSTMKFAGGDKTLSTAPGAIDRMSIYYDGANYFVTLIKNYS